MGYTKHAIRGAGWNGALQLATMALSALKVVILARLLSPNDFGLFALVAVTIGTAESFTETGINPTIIQSQKSIGYFLDTAWVISIIRGLLISVVMLLAGFVMQYVYNSQQLFVLIGVASLIPLIKGLINPAIITLQKDFRFFRDSVYRLLVLIIEVVSTITLAVLLHSVYAMVLGIVISALFEVAITWAMFSARPRFNYIRSRAKEIFDNMKGLNISSVLSYFFLKMSVLRCDHKHVTFFNAARHYVPSVYFAWVCDTSIQDLKNNCVSSKIVVVPTVYLGKVANLDECFGREIHYINSDQGIL
jgi:O-antigen/teichoic acid export membrane protein